MARLKKNHFFVILLFVAVTAILIRLVFCHDLYQKDPMVSNPAKATDMATYIAYAHRILDGDFNDAYYYQPFYYAVFLPVVYAVSAKSIWAVLTVQSILGGITVLLASLAAAKLAGKKAAIITLALLTLSKVLLLYTPYHLIATLQTFWVALIFYCMLLAMERNKFHHWIFVGLAAGLAILTRGNIWFFVPGIIVAAIYSGYRKSRKVKVEKKTLHHLKMLLPAAIVLFFILTPQLPFIIRNSRILGRLSGPSTAAGAVLSLGNTPEAPPGGRNPGSGVGPMEYPPTYHEWMGHQQETSIFRRILTWFSQEPLAFIELTFRKLLLFWDSREIPNNADIEFRHLKSSPLNRVYYVPTSLIIILALAGMMIAAGSIMKKVKFLLLFYFIVAYWLATSAFYILSRFRAPVIPLLAIFAAVGLTKSYLILKAKHNRRFAKIVLPSFFFSTFVCLLSYDNYRENFEPVIMRIARPNGVRVSFQDGRTMYLDNGPQTFGGWFPFARETMQKRPMILKTFASLNPSDYRQFELELPIFWNGPGEASFSVNGTDKRVTNTFPRPGVQIHKFTIPPPNGPVVDIRFLGSSVPVAFILDSQRDYGRTQLNGQPIPAELVCRLYAWKKDKQ